MTPVKRVAKIENFQRKKSEKEKEIKRPSVETEGRLTIACHMKILRKICVVSVATRSSLYYHPRCAHKFKDPATPKKEPNNIKVLNC